MLGCSEIDEIEGLLSRSMFASIFASYVNAGRIIDVVKTFEVMVVLGMLFR
jgi:hypothetical protein